MGACGAARIGHGDSVLNDPDSRRLSVTVACELSHARCEWSHDTASASRPLARPWRRRQRAAGSSQAPKPSAEIPALETGEISSSQRRDTRIPPAACTHTCVAASVLCIATAHRAGFFFQRT